METLEAVVEFLQNYQEYSLAMIFGMLILCGFGLPIPEDITLIAAGILSGIQVNSTHGHFALMLAFCLAGVLIGDGIMFIGGRVFGYKLQKYTPLRKVLPRAGLPGFSASSGNTASGPCSSRGSCPVSGLLSTWQPA